MKVLVTGGCGFVGCRLAPKLLAAGHEVRILDLGLYPNGVRFIRALNGVELFEGDLRDDNLVDKALDGRDAVIHLAAISNDPSAALDPQLTGSINGDATVRLFDKLIPAGVSRLVNMSSASVYGIQNPDESADESSGLLPQTLYARLKAETEGYCLALDGVDLTVISFRSATLSGWSPRPRLDLTSNIFCYQALFLGRLRIFGGQQFRPNLDVGDLADMLVGSLALPAARGGRPYNLSEGNYTVAEIALATTKDPAVRRGVAVEYVTSADTRSYRLNSELATRELGFGPKTTLAKSIAESLAGLAEIGADDAADDIYRNVDRMKELKIS